MKLDGILPFARKLLNSAVKDGDIVIDATLGNGHDTLFLANLVGSNGKVFSFDIQEQALLSSREKLAKEGFLDRVTVSLKGHEHIMESIPTTYYGKITGGIFNLGYLPGGDKSIVTKPNTTISAIDQLLSIMAKEGIIVLVIYHGHEEGQVEKETLLRYVKQLDQKSVHVVQYQFINQANHPPFIIAMEKR